MKRETTDLKNSKHEYVGEFGGSKGRGNDEITL